MGSIPIGLPNQELRIEALATMTQHLEELKLEAHPDKTEFIDFTVKGERIVAS